MRSGRADGVPLAERLRASSGRINSTYSRSRATAPTTRSIPTLGAANHRPAGARRRSLAGRPHYFKPTLDHRIYFEPFWKPALMMRWRLGWLMPPGRGKPAPTTETFRLGGTRPFDYLRGYDDYYIVPEENVRGVGPGQVRFPGGRVMFAFTAEFQFPLVNPVRGLFFLTPATRGIVPAT